MTLRQQQISRRNMFTIAAGSASALALGPALAGTARAADPLKVKPVHEKLLKVGLASAPGDARLDPPTQALAEKLLERSKDAMVAAVSSPNAAKDDKVVGAAKKIVGSLQAKRETRLVASVKKLSVAPAQMQAKQLKFKIGPAYTAELQNLLELKRREEPPKPKYTPPLAGKIEFYLNSVKCINMTDGESGSDEILLGGHIITPGGVVKKIDRFKVSDDFDTNEHKYYDFQLCNAFPAGQVPPFITCANGSRSDVYLGRKLAATNLGLDLPWPATIGISLVMAEEDPGGGFGQMLEEAYAAIRDEVHKELDKLGQKAGEAAGGGVWAAVAAAVAWAVGEFIDWLVNLFDNPDDLVATKSWTVQLPSPEMSAIRAMSNDPLPSPAGTWAAPMKLIKFKGDGGEFHANLHWRVRTA